MKNMRFLLVLIFIFGIFVVPLNAQQETKYNLAIVTLFQNEAPYFKEWIEYHRMLGVEHFYLYNNLSEDNYEEVLSPYIREEIVELQDWPIQADDLESFLHEVQIPIYNHVLVKAKKETRWLAVIDVDEFLVPVHDDNLISFLSKYEEEKIGGVCANWIMFGTSFVKKIPEDKLLIETLTLNRGDVHIHFKTILQPKRVRKFENMHYAKYKEPYHHIVLPRTEMNINHYWSRDEHFFYNVKVPRHQKWGHPLELCESWVNESNQETPYGEIILRFVEPLRRRVFGDFKHE